MQYDLHRMEIIKFDEEDVFAGFGDTTISGAETPGYDEENIKTPVSDI